MSIPSVKTGPKTNTAKKFGQYDRLVQLEMEKRKLERAIDINQTRINTGLKILKDKAEKKKASGQYVFTASQAMKVSNGYSVEDFRQPISRRIVNKVVKQYNPEECQPQVTKDPKILEIRANNVRNSVCKKKIDHLVRERRLAEERKKEREFKKLSKLERRKMPQISVPPSMLPNRYVRGELPCTIEHGINGQYLSWVAPLDNLDYEYYLPIFFDGLQCKQNPARFLARQGVEDLLYAARGYPNRIKSCVYSIVRPLRDALSKFDPDILLGVLKAIQQLVTCNDGIGEVLMPYSKQFLTPIATFMDLNKNIGDAIDYSQRKNNDIGENVNKTLELLEERGGPGAFKAIKASVPLYESCLQSKVVMRGNKTREDAGALH